LKKSISWLPLLLAAAAALGAQTAHLKEISYHRDGDKFVVDVIVDGAFSHEILVLNFPRRLVLDLTPVEKIAVPPHTSVDNLGVLNIRTGQFSPRTARVVFDLDERTPAHGVSPIPSGVRVTFWYEGGEPPLPPPPPAGAVKTEPAKVPETRPAPVEEPRGPIRSDFFLGARGGAALLLKSQLSRESAFSLFGETEALLENYTNTSGPVLDFVAGKYFHKIKAGAGLTIWSLKQKGEFGLSIPHPYLMNSPRDVSFLSDPLKSGQLNVYAFVEFAFYDSESFSVWAGVLAGLSKGAFQSLNDYDYSESSPYTASDIVISNVTYVEEAFTELLFGGTLAFEYRFNRALSVVLETKMMYANPKIPNLGLRANFLQVQPVLGLQVNF